MADDKELEEPTRRQAIRFGTRTALAITAGVALGSFGFKKRSDHKQAILQGEAGDLSDDTYLPDSARRVGHYTFTASRGNEPKSITITDHKISVATQKEEEIAYRFPEQVTSLDIECPKDVELVFRDCTIPAANIYRYEINGPDTVIKYEGKTSTNVQFLLDHDYKEIGAPVSQAENPKGFSR